MILVGAACSDLDDPEKNRPHRGEKAVAAAQSAQGFDQEGPGGVSSGAWPAQSSAILVSAINGSSICPERASSGTKMGQKIFGAGINIIDYPAAIWCLVLGRSTPKASLQAHALIDDGVLKNLDPGQRHRARAPVSPPTGHAGRSASSAPSPSATNSCISSGLSSVPKS